MRVEETMWNDVLTDPADWKLNDLAEKIAQGGHFKHLGLPIVDKENKLVSIITRGDVVRALEQDPQGMMPVREAGSKGLVVTYPDELLFEAAEKMLRNGVGRLPVVSRKDPNQIVGYLGRSGIMAARLKRLHEEHTREPGWIKRFSR